MGEGNKRRDIQTSQYRKLVGSKIRKIYAGSVPRMCGALTITLTQKQTTDTLILRDMAAVPPPAPERLAAPEPATPARHPGRTGRPPAIEETLQISLRLPKAWLSMLRRRAVEASAKEERTISPQEIVRRLVGQGLGIDG